MKPGRWRSLACCISITHLVPSFLGAIVRDSHFSNPDEQ
jgi:hypothetical protein